MPAPTVQPQRVLIPWDVVRDPAGAGTFHYLDGALNVSGDLLPVRVFDGPYAGGLQCDLRCETDRMRLDIVSLSVTNAAANLLIEVWSRHCDTPGRQLAAGALAIPGLQSAGLGVVVSTPELVPSWEIRARLTAGVGIMTLCATFDRCGAPALVQFGTLL